MSKNIFLTIICTTFLIQIPLSSSEMILGEEKITKDINVVFEGAPRDKIFSSPKNLHLSESETDANNTTVKGTEPFASPSPQNSLQERASTLNQLDKGLLINIVTLGNTSINAGDVVIIDLPKQHHYYLMVSIHLQVSQQLLQNLRHLYKVLQELVLNQHLCF